MIMLPNLIKLNRFHILTIPYQILKDVIWRIISDIEVTTKDCRYHVHVLDVYLEGFLKFMTTIILIPKTHYCLVDQVKNTLTQNYIHMARLDLSKGKARSE